MQFRVTVASQVLEGETTITFDIADPDFANIDVGWGWMARTQAGGGSSGGIWNEDVYRILTLDKETGVATFTPPWDGDPQSGNIGFTQSFGYKKNPYLPRGANLTDTMKVGAEVEFGGNPLFAAARGASYEIVGGGWTAQPVGQTAMKVVGSEGRGAISSISTTGAIVRNAYLFYLPIDGTVLQNDENYIRMEDNVYYRVGRRAGHFGGRGSVGYFGRNTVIECGAALFWSLDLTNSFLTDNIIMDSKSTIEHIFSGYGDFEIVGEHQTLIDGNLVVGGVSLIDVMQQSGRITISKNHVYGMREDGISVNAFSNPTVGMNRNAFEVFIHTNEIA
ncbi:MAG: hypothetical protein AAFP70_18150, partial [Calditrichota bacterium]